jgi:hypothetical protein
MILSDVVKKLDLNVFQGNSLLSRKVSGGYVSDLLSDVMANAKSGDLWVTLQLHINIIPVANIKDLAGIIIVNDRKPEQETLQKAQEESVPVLGSPLSAFALVGKLYELGISESDENV